MPQQTLTPVGDGPYVVLIVGHAYVLRVNQQKFDLLSARQGVRCVLLVPRRWRSEWGRDLPAESGGSSGQVDLVPTPVWLNGHAGGFFFPPHAAWRILRRVRPDVIHIEQESYSLVAFEMTALARLAGVPVVLFVWENVARKLSWFRRRTRSFTLRYVNTLVAGNQAAADLETGAGFDGRVAVLPQMGVDLGRFSQRQRRRESGTRLRVGFAGRLVSGKGVDLLLEACSQLINEGLPIRLTVIGSGPTSARLHELEARLGIVEHVVWTGGMPHDEVPAALASLDVVVLPSRRQTAWQEQFGRILIEAMAEGLPVVGSSSGEIPNVIGRADLVFTEGDAGDLARILRRLTTEPTFYDEASRHSLERVRAEFSQEHITDRTYALWEDVVDLRSSS